MRHGTSRHDRFLLILLVRAARLNQEFYWHTMLREFLTLYKYQSIKQQSINGESSKSDQGKGWGRGGEGRGGERFHTPRSSFFCTHRKRSLIFILIFHCLFPFLLVSFFNEFNLTHLTAVIRFITSRPYNNFFIL